MVLSSIGKISNEVLAKCDTCYTFPCKNGATCRPTGERDYECLCAPGYHGKLCESAIDACYGNPCRNSAICKVLEEGRFRYRELLGLFSHKVGSFHNALLLINLVATALPATREIVARPTSMTAWITNVLTTQPASIKSNLTAAIARAVTQVLIHSRSLNNEHFFLFLIQFSYYPPGTYCEKKIQFCTKEFNPCKNGATCVDRGDHYACQCALGFSGENCTVNNDDCISHMCQVLPNNLESELCANRFVDWIFHTLKYIERRYLHRRYQRIHLQVSAWILWQILRGLSDGQSVISSDFPLSTARLPERYLLPTSGVDRLHL